MTCKQGHCRDGMNCAEAATERKFEGPVSFAHNKHLIHLLRSKDGKLGFVYVCIYVYSHCK